VTASANTFYLLPGEIQAYVAASCLREAGFTVQFQTWKQLSKRLLRSSAASVAEELKEEGFSCILGGIDLSLRCVDFYAAVHF
jgi:hypothetical protein